MLSWGRVQSRFGFLPLTQRPSRARLRILRQPIFEIGILAENKLESLIDYVVNARGAEKLGVPVERGRKWFLDADVEFPDWDLRIRWSEQRHGNSPYEIKKAESIGHRQMSGKKRRINSTHPTTWPGATPVDREGFLAAQGAKKMGSLPATKRFLPRPTSLLVLLVLIAIPMTCVAQG
jgi:hypothetical protein